MTDEEANVVRRAIEQAIEAQRSGIVVYLREVAESLQGVRMVDYASAVRLVANAIELRADVLEGIAARETRRARVIQLAMAIPLAITSVARELGRRG